MILGIAPKFDDATEYSFKWFQELVKEVQSISTEKWVLLEKDGATRENVEAEFDKWHPELIVFYDHGNEDGLVAQGGHGYVIDLANVSKFKGKAIYTMACLSAKTLGVEHWRNGGVFWGYTEVFSFTLQDEELFMRCANAGLIARMKGATWDEALEIAKREFDKAIEEAEEVWTKVWLRHDRDALVCYTATNPPQSKCRFRRALLRLFGTRFGWTAKSRFAGILMMFFGLGVLVHDYAHTMYELGGYGEILSPQGGYVGLSIFLLGFYLREKGIYFKRFKKLDGRRLGG